MGEPGTNEIQDFEKKENERIPLRERRKKEKSVKAVFADHETQGMLVLFAAIVAAIGTVLLSILVFKIPVLVTCVMIALDVAIALCLRDVPIWLHGLVLAVELVTGIIVKRVVFMILCVVIYLLTILEMRFMRTQY